MYLEYSADQQELRRELRLYFNRLITPEVRAALNHPDGQNRETYRGLVRELGRDGWLGLGWPTEYGGQGRPSFDQFILLDEVQRADVPFPFVTINTVGPTIQQFGTDQQKRQYLPGILAGEILFAIGYSEPEAGTDLASLRTRAELVAGEWVINGSKVFTSGADSADFIWLACRTDPTAGKHKGISVIIVPTSSQGFATTPIVTPGLTITQSTYYEDVRVPYENVVGKPGGGWRLIMSQLQHERVGLAAWGGRTEQLWTDVRNWCASTEATSGGRVIDEGWVSHQLAKTYVRLEAMRLLNWRLAVAANDGEPSTVAASIAKVYSTETHDDTCHALLATLGAFATRRSGSPESPLEGRVEALARGSFINTFGGGTNEVLRDTIAIAGMGLPRGRRGTL